MNMTTIILAVSEYLLFKAYFKMALILHFKLIVLFDILRRL